MGTRIPDFRKTKNDSGDSLRLHHRFAQGFDFASY